jgi:hypothetical protein
MARSEINHTLSLIWQLLGGSYFRIKMSVILAWDADTLDNLFFLK